MNLFYAMVGYRTLYANAKNALRLLNLCMECGFSYDRFVSEEDGGVRFSCDEITARRLLRSAEARGICVAVLECGGMPHFLRRYRRRAGMALGLLLGAILIWLSGRYVWDVRVTGNEHLTSGEVCAILRENGFGVGSRLSELDSAAIENRVMIASDRIAWMSLYMDGTVARVQIRENEMPPAAESKRPANLVANCDGQIESLMLYRGNCLVKVGQAVRAGDLLVSGLYDSQSVGFYATRAAGEVRARVWETVRIEIPLTYEQKVWGEEKIGALSLDFFDFSLKFFENSRNRDTLCDIIEVRKPWEPLGISNVPVSLRIERITPYTVVTATRTHEEARMLAYEELARTLAARTEWSELLERRVETTLTDSALILDCTVLCIRNIAEQVEFEIVP